MSETDEIPPLNPVAFAIAMIGGPVIVTLCTIWMFLIPAVALVIGGIPYLVIGTPVALWMALTGPVTASRAALWGPLTIAAIAAPTAAITVVTGKTGDAAGVLFVAVICAVFATLWAATSGWIYSAITTTKPN